VKNLFGTVPGGIKSVLHATGSTREKFASLIVDIYSVIKPGLTVMDGVVGLGGMWREQDKIYPGVIIAGIDAVAVDAVAAQILGYDPMSVPILANAHRRGFGIADLHEIEVIGEQIESVIKNMGAKPKHFTAPGFGSAVSGALLGKERPQLIPEACTGCGHCPKACPVGAVSVVDGKPVFDMDKCIRCFCCIELCPQRALRITRGRIGNLFLKR
jgi:ferredoxin